MMKLGLIYWLGVGCLLIVGACTWHARKATGAGWVVVTNAFSQGKAGHGRCCRYEPALHRGVTVQFFGFCPEVEPESPDRNNCLLTFRFGGVENVKLDGFNHQNAINGFTVVGKWSERLNREVFNVEIIQGFGVGSTFDCDEIEVVSVNPAVPHKRREGI
jgi:hypothetical protein